MTSPRLATQTPHGRMYARTPGGPLGHPSITTVLDVLNQHMEWWEAYCAIEKTFEYLPNVAGIAQMPPGPARTTKERDAKRWLREAATRDRDDSATRGDFVHNYAEVYALRSIGQATDADVQEHFELCQRAGVGAYLPHFHQWWQDWQPIVVQPEATVWNETVGYAGTTDLLFKVNIGGREVNVVGDFKTKKALFKNGRRKSQDLRDYTGMQLAAAARAEEIWIPGQQEDGSDAVWQPMTFQAEVGVGIGIAPDGYVVRQYDIFSPVVFETFKALRRAWDFRVQGPATMSSPLDSPGDLILPQNL